MTRVGTVTLERRSVPTRGCTGSAVSMATTLSAVAETRCISLKAWIASMSPSGMNRPVKNCRCAGRSLPQPWRISESIDREIGHIPVRESHPPAVVPDIGEAGGHTLIEPPPAGVLPLELQVSEPAQDAYQRRSLAHSRVGDADAVGGGAEADLLFHARRPLPTCAAMIRRQRWPVKA